MSRNYFSLPFNSNSLITNKAHNKCSIKQSIAHFIHLLTTSYFGECTFDDTFGCSIVDSLFESIKKHEKRLTKTRIEVTIKQEEIAYKEKSTMKIFYTMSIFT